MNLLFHLFGAGDAHRGVTQSLDLRSLLAFATASKLFNGLLGKIACGQVWVIGKTTHEQTGNPVVCYDVHQNVWESCPALPVACEFTTAVEMDNEIYVLGWNSEELVALFVVFDQRRKVWDNIGEVPLAFSTHCDPNVVVLHGHIYIMGDIVDGDGADDPSWNPVRIAAYSKASSWELLPQWPSGNFDSSMLALNGLIYLVGACDELIYFEHYDPISGRWTDLADSVGDDIQPQLKQVLNGVGASQKSARHVFAFGQGILASHAEKKIVMDFRSSPTSLVTHIKHDLWFYSCESGRWARQEPMPTPRQTGSSCLKLGKPDPNNRGAAYGDMYYIFGCQGAEGHVEGYSFDGGWNIYRSSHFGRHYKYVPTKNGNRLIAIGGYHATDEDDESSSESFYETHTYIDEDDPTASPTYVGGGGRRRKKKKCYEEHRNHVEMFTPRPGGINPGGIWKIRAPLPNIKGRDILTASACGIHQAH